jgi:hypothetical protein
MFVLYSGVAAKALLEYRRPLIALFWSLVVVIAALFTLVEMLTVWITFLIACAVGG